MDFKLFIKNLVWKKAILCTIKSIAGYPQRTLVEKVNLLHFHENLRSHFLKTVWIL